MVQRRSWRSWGFQDRNCKGQIHRTATLHATMSQHVIAGFCFQCFSSSLLLLQCDSGSRISGFSGTSRKARLVSLDMLDLACPQARRSQVNPLPYRRTTNKMVNQVHGTVVQSSSGEEQSFCAHPLLTPKRLRSRYGRNVPCLPCLISLR